MTYKTCTNCGGIGTVNRAQYARCSNCNGSGRTYGSGDTCFKCGGNGQEYVNKNDTCGVCGGTGQTYTQDPYNPPKTSRKPSNQSSGKNKTSSGTNSSSSNWGGVRGVFALAGFFVGAIPAYDAFDESLVAAGIVGVIVGYLAGLWYKALIVIAIIIFILYLVYENS